MPVVSEAGTRGVIGVIGKEHKAEMVDVGSMVGTSKEDEVMVPVIGTIGMANWQGRVFWEWQLQQVQGGGKHS
jgi:hypothetical protein